MYQRNEDCDKCKSKVFYDEKHRKVFCRCGAQNKEIKAFSSWHTYWQILGGEKFHRIDNSILFQKPKIVGAPK